MEGHLLDLVLEQGVTPLFFMVLKLDHFAHFLNLTLLELKLTCYLKLKFSLTPASHFLLASVVVGLAGRRSDRVEATSVHRAQAMG